MATKKKALKTFWVHLMGPRPVSRQPDIYPQLRASAVNEWRVSFHSEKQGAVTKD